MRILIINPNSDLNTNNILKNKAELVLKDLSNISVEVMSIPEAPILVGSYMDYHKSANRMIDIVSKDEYDAYIIACHSDPNIDLIKEITQKPVIGIGEASFKVASMLGNSFIVISPSLKSESKKRKLVRSYHLEDMFIGTVVTKSDSKEDLLAASEYGKQKYNPDTIVLGCANYAMYDKDIEDKLGLPVIDGVASAISMVVGLYNYWKYKNN